MSARGKLTIREFFQPVQAFQNPASAKKQKGKFSLSILIIRPLLVALQSKSCDLTEAYKDAQNLVKVLEKVRNDKERLGRLFTRASEIAATADVEPSKPRTAARQKGRANAPANSTHEYYRLNFFLPFVDHVLAHLKTRFSEEKKDAMLGFYLIPNQLNNLTDEVIKKIKVEFQDDLPYPDSFDAEVRNAPLQFQQKQQIQ